MEAIRTKAPRIRDADADDGDIAAQSEIHLPPLTASYEYLIELFFNSGQAMQTGFGLVALSWAELKAFVELNELELCLWEIDLLKKISEAYCAEYSRASDPKRPCPYQPERQDEEEIDQVGKALNILESLRSFGKK